ncbi:hypothetical protein [Dyella sp. GSA-30]|uniref:hypothetical protein n=1 Tax=Dyella sp. GSA-30 TaxID=2994496 RepID=UPI0024920A1C|nr:hypothetical protein [Dyella sp. GSA-30]
MISPWRTSDRKTRSTADDEGDVARDRCYRSNLARFTAFAFPKFHCLIYGLNKSIFKLQSILFIGYCADIKINILAIERKSESQEVSMART